MYSYEERTGGAGHRHHADLDEILAAGADRTPNPAARAELASPVIQRPRRNRLRLAEARHRKPAALEPAHRLLPSSAPRIRRRLYARPRHATSDCCRHRGWHLPPALRARKQRRRVTGYAQPTRVDDAATKLIWLALRNITAGWGNTAHDWKEAINQFAILYADRFRQATA